MGTTGAAVWADPPPYAAPALRFGASAGRALPGPVAAAAALGALIHHHGVVCVCVGALVHAPLVL
eukprot:gene35437-6239_t